MEILLYSEILEVDTASLCLSNAAHTGLILSNTVRATPVLTVKCHLSSGGGFSACHGVCGCVPFWIYDLRSGRPTVHLQHYDVRIWHFDVDSQCGMTTV